MRLGLQMTSVQKLLELYLNDRLANVIIRPDDRIQPVQPRDETRIAISPAVDCTRWPETSE